MLKIENTDVVGWEHAIRGMHNPMGSWNKRDSYYCVGPACPEDAMINWCKNECPYYKTIDCENNVSSPYFVGPKDFNLMSCLRDAGTDHRKFMRMIVVYLDITAPLYWWKEFDTYKVGTIANSCSTMHKIADKEFTLNDFSCEYLYTEDDVDGMYYSSTAEEEFTSTDVLKVIIEALNNYRKMYLATMDKKHWWQMVQLLPSSYNQRRTVMLNYEVLTNIYKSRKNHKLDEWVKFCKWVENLPYSTLITGKENSNAEN